MLAIRFDFTANRYHATQWGRHVNEGVLEWPPSPWRILRAIVATWQRTLPDLPRESVAPILEKLASERPLYRLPPASTGHARHYMPYNEGSRERTTLVMDSFVAIQPDEPVVAIWPNVELDQRQTRDLADILRNMPYLGRAESWVDARITPDSPEPNSAPQEDGALPDGAVETVRTLVPRPTAGLEDLMVETSDLRRSGRIDPEGAMWWLYTRSSDCFASFRTQELRACPPAPAARVVRFALASNVPPMVRDTLRWGDLARRSAMARFGRQNGKRLSSTLSGRSESGEPLRGHRHCFYLPTDEDSDGRLDRLTVWARAGLDPQEFQAIVSMTHLNPGRGREPVRLVYQAHGEVEDFAGVSPLFESSIRWRSLTPYVLTRHVKYRGPRDESGHRRQVDGPEDQVRREVELRWPGRVGVADVSIHDRNTPIRPMGQGVHGGVRPIDFFRHRAGGSHGGGSYNFTVELSEEVQGPVTLGFACHYGLGLFVPAD